MAIAGDEEIAGYGVFQIWEENPKIVEMAQGVVKPEFPSPGVFWKYYPISVRSGKIPRHPGRLWRGGYQPYGFAAYGSRIWFQRLRVETGSGTAEHRI